MKSGFLLNSIPQFSKEQIFLFVWVGLGMFFVLGIFYSQKRMQRRNFRSYDPTAPVKRNLKTKTPPQLKTGQKQSTASSDRKQLKG